MIAFQYERVWKFIVFWSIFCCTNSRLPESFPEIFGWKWSEIRNWWLLMTMSVRDDPAVVSVTGKLFTCISAGRRLTSNVNRILMTPSNVKMLQSGGRNVCFCHIDIYWLTITFVHFMKIPVRSKYRSFLLLHSATSRCTRMLRIQTGNLRW